MSIADVDFGRVDAEGETNLVDYFVDTGVLSRIKSGRKQYIVGRKGSGKTALFILASEEQLGRTVIQLDFADYAWESHKQIHEAGLSAESAYTASWRFTFLMAVCDYWRKHATGEVSKRAANYYRNIYGNEQPRTLEFLVDKFRRVRRIDLPSIEGVFSMGGIEFDEREAGPMLATSISQWSKEIFDFVKEYYDNFPFTITLDRLDDGWDATEESKMLLVGVLKAARDFNQALRRPNQPPAVLTFLRSDIFNEIRFNDKNKIVADIEYLEWTESKLIDVISTRIGRSLHCDIQGAWDRVFSGIEMRQRASIQSYILKRTMWRPRDIIAFCIHCQEVATEQGHDIVETTDVYQAEDRFSRHIYDELDDEMGKQFPEARDALQTIRDMGLTRFRLQNWVKAAIRRNPQITEDQARQRLQALFDYSVVGVPRRGGIVRGTSFQFVYHDRLLEPNFESEMIVHPSLKKHLGLKDPRPEKQ